MIIKLRKKKKWYWVLLADNGRVWATSETYATYSNAWRAAKHVWHDINKAGMAQFPLCDLQREG